ncbi:MBL fold metallo-hydrolase [Prosthecomicrobium hirschii]|uniref:MBL fold metallo-hydrolase n=2 Tax=Prosthecodimorpha hirschii TaxID=665126 RepID=A0A0P6VI60_9HYPH|nr:ribonuclease J [Prosthecomicrobium hirschii]KPL50772.1 MBL fold metallo-hydrolase [Prosthecomicrobium hirschii]
MRKRREGDDLVFLPLGGVGEIGMNCALYGFGPEADRKWIMVDLGITFANEFDEPGVDVIFPDLRFAESEKRNILGLIITHAHEDHFGALLDLWPRLKVPVYMTPFAHGLLEAKAEGHAGAPEIAVRRYKAGERWTLGPFEIEAINVAHSIPESNALAIRTALGTVIHTGDWKVDPTPVLGAPTDFDRLAAYGAEGVRALICDSTNAVREGISPSEREVATSLTEIIRKAPQRVAVTTFASNVGRIRAVAEAAVAADRSVVILGRAMHRAIDVATELGMFEGLPGFLGEDAYGYLPRDRVVALMTGSQGEPRAALAKVASGEHRNIALSQGDTVIFSSRTIPGNEKAVNTIQNQLATAGVHVITDRDGLVHVSGHPRRGELARMYEAVKPEVSIPVHGEAVHLNVHADFARSCGVKRAVIGGNGKMIRLAPDPAEIVDEVFAGRLFKDGRLVVLPDDSGVRERRKASFAGVIVVSLALDGKGTVAAEPEAVLVGIPSEDEVGKDFEDVVVDAAEQTMAGLPKAKRRDLDLVADAVKRSVRAAVAERWGKKPIVEVIVHEVD